MSGISKNSVIVIDMDSWRRSKLVDAVTAGEDKPSAGGMSIIKTIGYFSMFLSVLYDWPVS